MATLPEFLQISRISQRESLFLRTFMGGGKIPGVRFKFQEFTRLLEFQESKNPLNRILFLFSKIPVIDEMAVFDMTHIIFLSIDTEP